MASLATHQICDGSPQEHDVWLAALAHLIGDKTHHTKDFSTLSKGTRGVDLSNNGAGSCTSVFINQGSPEGAGESFFSSLSSMKGGEDQVNAGASPARRASPCDCAATARGGFESTGFSRAGAQSPGVLMRSIARQHSLQPGVQARARILKGTGGGGFKIGQRSRSPSKERKWVVSCCLSKNYLSYPWNFVNTN